MAQNAGRNFRGREPQQCETAVALSPYFDWVFHVSGWIALLTLTAMEVVLGIDNVLFISLIGANLPEAKARIARMAGLILAFVSRDHHDTEVSTHKPGVRKKSDYFFRARIGSDVVIVRVASEEPVPNTSSNKNREMAVRLQNARSFNGQRLLRHADRIFASSFVSRMT